MARRLAAMLLCWLAGLSQGWGGESVTLAAGDTEFYLEVIGEKVGERVGEGEPRLLWLPSEYGLQGERERAMAEGVAERDVEVWLADLHASYFINPGRSSLNEMAVEDVAALIHALHEQAAPLYLLSSGRGAALLLGAVREWRTQHPEASPLGGVILLHPNLAVDSPEAGRDMEYLPIASASNLPIYLMQPTHSAKIWHLSGLVERLEAGGSDLYRHVLQDVSDGFEVRGDATPREREVRGELPRMLVAAMELLDPYNDEIRGVPAPDMALDLPAWKQVKEAGLHPFRGDPQPPELRLADMRGRIHDLRDYLGQVVLVNFWATWCPPCVEEIPSMGRLAQRLGERGFTILAANLGEPRARVAEFLETTPADFPVLLDEGGDSAASWSIRAYPTSFLVDREGIIRYAYFGALEWDSDSVIETIEPLLQR